MKLSREHREQTKHTANSYQKSFGLSLNTLLLVFGSNQASLRATPRRNTILINNQLCPTPFVIILHNS